MLEEYRIESTSVGQYLDRIDSGDVKVDQAVQRAFCWNAEMMNGLLYSAISRRVYIPNLILAEEIRKDKTKQTYVVDGGQRTETLRKFRDGEYRITKNIRNHIVQYQRKKIENGEVVKNEYGDIQWEIVDYDVRNKKYEDLPDELKIRFNGCSLVTTVYQECTAEETDELVLLYNNHMSMNVSQKAFTYIGKFAEEIKRIKESSRFLLDGTILTEAERKKGVWERVISECVMLLFHFDNWNKAPKVMCDFLNQNSSIEEYRKVEEFYNRLSCFSDKLDNPKVAELFSSKNLFVWVKVFSCFDKLGLEDSEFGRFLNAFISGLDKKDIDGNTWKVIDEKRNTKDKKTICEKVDFLTSLMYEFLAVEVDKGELTKEQTDEEFIAECVDLDTEAVTEDIDCYKDALDDYLTRTAHEKSRLREDANRKSLLAMVAYSYKEDIDLEHWFEEYAKNNNAYFIDQKKNYLHMKNDLENYINRKDTKSA